VAENASTRIQDLLSSLPNTTVTGQHFIYDDLKRNIARELGFDALTKSIPAYRIPGIVEGIIEKGLRLLCSLVWRQQEDHIMEFPGRNKLDHWLPIISEAAVKNIAPNFDSRFYQKAQ
jgi:hypothetical protein